MSEKCPVCRNDIKTTDNACSICGFTDLHREFITKEDGELWIKNVVEPYKKQYEASKKPVLDDGFDSDGYNKDGYDKDGYNRNGKDVKGKSRNFYKIKKLTKRIIIIIACLICLVGIIYALSKNPLFERYEHEGAEIHTRIFDGNVYKGELNEDGEREGWGKCTYHIGVYEGNWSDGSRSEGKMTYNNGDTYEGKFGGIYFSDGMWNDRFYEGKYVWENGASYDGHWSAGGSVSGEIKVRDYYPDGMGKFIYENGDVYEGEWSFGSKSGEGKMTYANGDVYEGEWHWSKRDGAGAMHLSNGESYTGYWENDVLISKYSD